MSIGNNSKHSISNKSHDSTSYRTKRSGGERSSVVDELLAEADDDQILQHGVIEYSDRTNTARYWPREEKKVTETAERRGGPPVVVPTVGSSSSIPMVSSPNNAIEVTPSCCPTVGSSSSIPMMSSPNNASTRISQQQQQSQANNDEYNPIYIRSSKEEIDALIEESLRQSDTPEEDEEQEDIESDAKYGGDDEEDDDMESDYDGDDQEEGQRYEDDENDENEPGGAVLGRLSRKAGGTTGVVLDPESDSTSTGPENKSSGYFSSVVNSVTSAFTPDRQRIMDKRVAAAAAAPKHRTRILLTRLWKFLPSRMSKPWS